MFLYTRKVKKEKMRKTPPLILNLINPIVLKQKLFLDLDSRACLSTTKDLLTLLPRILDIAISYFALSNIAALLLTLSTVNAALCLFSVITCSLYKYARPTAPPGPSITMKNIILRMSSNQLFSSIPADLASQAK